MNALPKNFTDFAGNQWPESSIAQYNKIVASNKDEDQIVKCARFFGDTVDMLCRMNETI